MTLQNSVAADQMGVVMSAFAFFQLLGGSIGVVTFHSGLGWVHFGRMLFFFEIYFIDSLFFLFFAY